MMLKTVFLLLSAVGIFTVDVNAQLFLEQGKVVIAVSPGEHTSGSLLIHNTSSDKSIVKVYWEDFEYKTPYDGTKEFLPAGTAPGSASQWVIFSPQVFTLPAFGRQKINYTVTVPSTIKEGHYGVLFFERSSDPLNSDTGVTLVTRVGCLFFIEPKEKNKKAVLQDIGLKGNNLTASFVNQGTVVLIPHTTYYIMEGEGMVLLRGEAKKLYIPAGATASLEIPLKKEFKAGQYTLVVNSDLEDGDVVVKEIGLAVNGSGQLTIENTQN